MYGNVVPEILLMKHAGGVRVRSITTYGVWTLRVDVRVRPMCMGMQGSRALGCLCITVIEAFDPPVCSSAPAQIICTTNHAPTSSSNPPESATALPCEYWRLKISRVYSESRSTIDRTLPPNVICRGSSKLIYQVWQAFAGFLSSTRVLAPTVRGARMKRSLFDELEE